MVSTPKAPDPQETASAQAGMNRDTATTQQLLNMTNQVGPNGSLTYNQSGSNSFVGADGKTVNLPQFTATTTLSPEQQAIKTQSDKASLNLGTLAAEQSGKLQQYLNDPFKFTNDDASQWAYDLASPRILQQQGQNQDQLRTTLANKGIREGSAAWNAEMSRMTNADTDQLNQLALNGRSQAYSEAVQNRNQPINEITALMSGSQVAAPQFQQTPQTGVGGVDYTGLVNQKYQADVANSQATNGGLFGLGSSLIGALPWSDRRLKTDIKLVGKLFNGVSVYSYRLKGGPVQIGVMADEVPEASVMDPNGFYHVDYAKATEAPHGSA
jgi:hypothetical protein